MKQYVQHISGQGEKWLVHRSLETCWEHITAQSPTYYLPKSEYVMCQSPDEWEDVTEAVEFIYPHVGFGYLAIGGVPIARDMYRLRKVDLMYEHCNHTHAFFVEKRKP